MIQKPSILEVVGDRVQLRRAGRRLRGLCPFHAEKTPSFTVDDTKGLFYCFGCQAKGDVIAFVMKIDCVDFKQALVQLGINGGEYKPKPVDNRKRHAAALLADWLNDQHLKAGAILRELSRQIAIAEQIPSAKLVESLSIEWEILADLFDDLQRPQCAAELLESKTSIEVITAAAPVEPLPEFPELKPEYRELLAAHLPAVEVGGC